MRCRLCRRELGHGLADLLGQDDLAQLDARDPGARVRATSSEALRELVVSRLSPLSSSSTDI
jgi:hypothetical protein